ncbi:hypothetical protein DK28_0201505 [Peptococcaceae bacterium SCADC1_2_3]|nr:hypothetical protein DK28_0201505 [Peptococcaceae bacterium SCADC1_2_3]KFI34713.1 hypothetical protein HY00_10345 [Peptococcaceae bacterium SCADC1_2_3]HBQ27844.1 hypothetical protein [Desulfotomaculum sp.]HCJ78556.1 hypothetical protein [Desulfotomaculum sp.]
MVEKQRGFLVLNKWAAIFSFLNLILLVYLSLHRSFTLAGIFCFNQNCPSWLLLVGERVSVAAAGVFTVAGLTIFCFLARQSKLWQFLALLLALLGSGVSCYLVSFQVQVLKSLCVLCLISAGFFFLTLIILGIDFFIQVQSTKSLTNQKT